MTEKENLGIHCLFCGTENDENSLYCKNCGQALPQETTEPIIVNNSEEDNNSECNKKTTVSDSEKYISTVAITGILVATISTCLDVYNASDWSRDIAVLCFIGFGVITLLCASYSATRIKDFKLNCAVGSIVLFAGYCFRPELMSSDVWLQDYYVWYVLGAVIYCVLGELMRDYETNTIELSSVESKTLADDEQICPNCNKIIKKSAKKCRFCGKWFEDNNGGQQ